MEITRNLLQADTPLTGAGENAKPCYTVFALGDLVVSGA
jgi:hypothetical protein